MLYTPIVDSMGHTVGHNTERVTLPYSFKTIKTNGRGESISENATGTPVVKDVIADKTKDELALNSGNRWIRIDTNDGSDSLTFSHDIHEFDITSNGTTNLNKETGANDEGNINIPDWTYDEAGHITSKKDHTYTLPFGFKTIKTNGRSTEVAKNATTTPVTTDVVADTTQDILTINSGNKWVRIDTDATNDSLIIRHDVHNTSSTENTTDWTVTEANTTIPTVTYSFDEAGHYVSHHAENYKLPFGYGKIAGDVGTTAATATYDELTFSSDEWLTATISKDKVTYSHDYPKKVDDTTSTSNVNGNGDTIILETLSRDDKGHITKVNNNTVTLPYGYKFFKDSESTVGNSEAKNTQDTFVFGGDS